MAKGLRAAALSAGTLIVFLAASARAGTDSDFLAAVSTGDTAKAGALIVQGAAVNAVDPGGRTALMIAAGNGDADMAQLLLDRGADVQAQDPQGRSALAAAARSGEAEVARMLLEYGAAVDARSRDGVTPLMVAASAAGDLSTMRILLLHGADAKARDNDGFSVLMYAAMTGRAPLLQALLDAGADPNVRDRDDETALMIAAEAGSADAVSLLLQRGADPRAKDAKGRTALALARRGKKEDVVALLSGQPSKEARADAVRASSGAFAVAAATTPEIFGPGPEPEAEEALRAAYLRFFDRDPSDPISLETAETLRESSAAIIPKDLKENTLAMTDGDDIFLNVGWLVVLYTSDQHPAGGSPWGPGSYRRSMMNTWLQSPAELDAFVARTASLIAHEAGHIRYGRDLAGETYNDYWQDLQCRYRQVLFLRHRVRSDPDFLGLRDYDALMRQRLKEPASGRPWWSDPLPDDFNERLAIGLDDSLRRDFPGRFDYSLEWSWYRMRLLNNGLASFQAHLLQEVRGDYEDPWRNSESEISELKNDIEKQKRWLREHKKPDPGDPWTRRIVEMALDVDKLALETGGSQTPSPAYKAYFELENTRLEGMLAQELYSFKPGPAWRSPALGPPSKKAPPLALKHLLGAPVRSVASWGDLRGNLVLLEFWATWCGPCQATIPHMNALVKAMRGKPVRFISVTDEDPKDVEPFLKSHRLSAWIDAEGDDALSDRYGVTMIPTAFLVDKNGTLIEQIDPRNVTPALLLDRLAGKRPQVVGEDSPIRAVISDDGEEGKDP